MHNSFSDIWLFIIN